jgi:hypothetical protein
MTTPSPKPRTRRFLQFSLRTLLIFVFLVSVGMSWFAVKMEKARRQKEAIAQVEGLGGRVLYDYECDYYEQMDSFLELLNANPPESPWPLWLRETLGDDFFHCVAEVGLQRYGPPWVSSLDLSGLLPDLPKRDCLATGRDLDVLKAFPRLRILRLDDQPLADSADSGLENLAMLSELQFLSLNATGITDADLEHIMGMRNLQELSLKYTQVTPEGVQKLKRALPACEIEY